MTQGSRKLEPWAEISERLRRYTKRNNKAFGVIPKRSINAFGVIPAINQRLRRYPKRSINAFGVRPS